MARNQDFLDPRLGVGATAAFVLAFWTIPSEADWQLRGLISLCVGYLSASAFFHPRYSVSSGAFTPIVVLKFLTIVAFCFNALYLAGGTTDLVDDQSLVMSTLAVLLNFLVADVLVLVLPRPVSTLAVEVPERTGRRSALAFFWALYVGGWIWRLYALANGLLYGTLLATSLEVTSYSNLLAALTQIGSVAFAGILVFSSRLRPAAIILVLEIAWKWVGSSKAGPLYVVLPLLLAMHARGRLRIDGRLVAITAVMTLLFLGSFVVIHEYRVESQRIILKDGYGSFSPIEAAKNVRIDAESFDDASRALAERLGWAQGAATVERSVRRESTGLMWGDTYWRATSWLVPRAIWPSKPPVSLGAWFGQEYLGWSAQSRSEAEITVWGEAFLNWGFVGAVVVPSLWLFSLQAFAIVCLRRGAVGLFVLVAAYVPLLNALAVNVAVTVAALGQTTLLCALVYVGSRVSGLPARTQPGV